MKYIDDFVGKGLSLWVILELITLNLAWMVVLAVPMSVLIAVLMAFGGMSSQNEITAMKASGISLYKMMLAPLLASFLLTYLTIEFNNKVLPEANHKAKTLMIDIRKKKPTLMLNPGLFSQDVSGYSILVRKTFQHSNDLEGVTIYDYTDPASMVVITAKKGRVSFTPDYKKLIMDLEEGEIHQKNFNQENDYRRLRFTKHRILMDAREFALERSEEGTFQRGDRELSAQTMLKIVDSLKTQNNLIINNYIQSTKFDFDMQNLEKRILQNLKLDKKQVIENLLEEARYKKNYVDNQLMMINYNISRIDEYLVEIHKKYSIPFACIVFILIGAPLGIISRRGGFGIAATLSLGFFVLYWASLIAGEKLADRDIISPFIGMWAANIIIGLAGIYLTIRMGRETPAINWKFFRKFVPKTYRIEEQSEDLNR